MGALPFGIARAVFCNENRATGGYCGRNAWAVTATDGSPRQSA